MSQPALIPALRAPRAVLFDHDGTLVDSLAVVVAATNAALHHAGHAVCTRPEIIVGMMLPTAPRMAQHARIAGDGRHLAALYYDQAIRLVHLATAYDGMAATLAAIAHAGVAMAVVSNNESRFVHAAMRSTALDRHIAQRYGEDDVPAPKPDPRGLLLAAQRLGIAAEHCVYVGDSPVDAQAANAAGMPAIGVTWGTHARHDMDGHGFSTLIDHPSELLRICGVNSA